MNVTGPVSPGQVAHAPLPAAQERLMAVARELEASFLAEMLKSAGVGEARKAFGGGAGEDQFSSFLVRDYADATVQAGGIGLAESIYKSLLQTKEAES